MESIWKDICGFEGLYSVSTKGEVRSHDKTVPRGKNGTLFIKGRIMKQNLAGPKGKQYRCVHLYKDGRRYCMKVHKIVANTFIQNPYNLPCINHKDEDKLNNCVENLEWCTYSYNNTYNGVNVRNSEKQLNNPETSIRVSQYTEDGTYIRTFPSISEAVRVTGIDSRTIRGSCKSNNCRFSTRRTKHGYRWRSEKKCYE